MPAPRRFAALGGAGVVSPDGTVRYLALRAPTGTLLQALNVRSGTVRHERSVPGVFGIPILTFNGVGEGLSHDGRTLVIETLHIHGPTTFRLVDTRTLRTRITISLRGGCTQTRAVIRSSTRSTRSPASPTA